MLVCIIRAKGLFRAMKMMGSNPYIMFIIVYVVLMALVFTAISNFGTLARQRAMVLPIFMMLLAIRTGPLDESEDELDTEQTEHNDTDPEISPAQEGERQYVG